MPEFNAPAPAKPVIQKQRDIQIYGWLIGLHLCPSGAPRAFATFEQPLADGSGTVIATFEVPDSQLFDILQEHLSTAAASRLDQDRPRGCVLLIWHDGSEWRVGQRFS
jgi:hypothetical protein